MFFGSMNFKTFCTCDMIFKFKYNYTPHLDLFNILWNEKKKNNLKLILVRIIKKDSTMNINWHDYAKICVGGCV